MVMFFQLNLVDAFLFLTVFYRKMGKQKLIFLGTVQINWRIVNILSKCHFIHRVFYELRRVNFQYHKQFYAKFYTITQLHHATQISYSNSNPSNIISVHLKGFICICGRSTMF